MLGVYRLVLLVYRRSCIVNLTRNSFRRSGGYEPADSCGHCGGRPHCGLFRVRPILEPISCSSIQTGQHRPSKCATTSIMCRSNRNFSWVSIFLRSPPQGRSWARSSPASMFGWLPALLWILIGSIFIGGVHDMTALTASIRHKARSIAEVVRDHMSQRSYIMFLVFIWIALVYIIVAFADITAAAFVGGAEDVRLGTSAVAPPAVITAETIGESGGVTGGAIATSSLLYLALPVVMGLLLRYTRLSLGLATSDLRAARWSCHLDRTIHSSRLGFDCPALQAGSFAGSSRHEAQKIWGVLLLGYCLIAGVVPVWLLLQPRGHLGGFFLYAALLAGTVGVLFGGFHIQFDAFKGFDAVGSRRGNLFSVSIHPDRLRSLLRLSRDDCVGHHLETASPRNRRSTNRLRLDAPRSHGGRARSGVRDDFAGRFPGAHS